VAGRDARVGAPREQPEERTRARGCRRSRVRSSRCGGRRFTSCPRPLPRVGIGPATGGRPRQSVGAAMSEVRTPGPHDRNGHRDRGDRDGQRGRSNRGCRTTMALRRLPQRDSMVARSPNRASRPGVNSPAHPSGVRLDRPSLRRSHP
jgi:hypothetical protein